MEDYTKDPVFILASNYFNVGDYEKVGTDIWFVVSTDDENAYIVNTELYPEVKQYCRFTEWGFWNGHGLSDAEKEFGRRLSFIDDNKHYPMCFILTEFFLRYDIDFHKIQKYYDPEKDYSEWKKTREMITMERICAERYDIFEKHIMREGLWKQDY